LTGLWQREEYVAAVDADGWEFDIRTGQSYYDPERIRTNAYPVAPAPVRVEEEYVVVDV
jgi:nitrite reductase/ring-hydroxylating ferredoxin subunit